MESFKRKPKTANQFYEEMENINQQGETNKQKVGRPKLPIDERTLKSSVSFRVSEEKIIDSITDTLVENGFKKPFPTVSEIFRMGVLSLKDLNKETLVDLYNKAKI